MINDQDLIRLYKMDNLPLHNPYVVLCSKTETFGREARTQTAKEKNWVETTELNYTFLNFMKLIKMIFQSLVMRLI